LPIHPEAILKGFKEKKGIAGLNAEVYSACYAEIVFEWEQVGTVTAETKEKARVM
jgi:hypothetical protein